MWNFIKLFRYFWIACEKIFVPRKTGAIFPHSTKKDSSLPRCKERSFHIHGYGRKRKILHGTILEKQCILELVPRRFFCTNCNSVFTEQVPFVQPRQRVTLKHKREVIGNLADRSFSSGTRKYGVSYSTQRKWLIELVSDSVYNFDEEKKQETPFVLGIDEVSFAGRDMVTTIGNITTHKLKGVLRSKRKEELKKVLRSISPEVKL